MLYLAEFRNLTNLRFATISKMRRNPCFENMSENESQAHQDLAVRGMILNWSNQRPINHPIFVKMSIENPHGNRPIDHQDNPTKAIFLSFQRLLAILPKRMDELCSSSRWSPKVVKITSFRKRQRRKIDN